MCLFFVATSFSSITNIILASLKVVALSLRHSYWTIYTEGTILGVLKASSVILAKWA